MTPAALMQALEELRRRHPQDAWVYNLFRACERSHNPAAELVLGYEALMTHSRRLLDALTKLYTEGPPPLIIKIEEFAMEEKTPGMFRGDDHYQTIHYNDVMIATKTPRGWYIIQGGTPPKDAYRAIAHAVWGTNNSSSAGDLAERANAEIHGKRDAQA